jgi:hypothetical protein
MLLAVADVAAPDARCGTTSAAQPFAAQVFGSLLGGAATGPPADGRVEVGDGVEGGGAGGAGCCSTEQSCGHDGALLSRGGARSLVLRTISRAA